MCVCCQLSSIFIYHLFIVIPQGVCGSAESQQAGLCIDGVFDQP